MIVNASLASLYASYGVAVFPCQSEGSMAKAPFISRGHHAASSEDEKLQFWRLAYPSAIYGLPCAANDLFVLDADRHGEADGVEALMAVFAQYGFDLRTVPYISTPGNGLHVIFRRAPRLGRTKGKIGPAIDTRDRGYIIAPGCVLPDGRQYTLLNGTIEELALAIANEQLPIMPDWLVSLVQLDDPASTPEPRPTLRLNVTPNQLAGLIRLVATASPGERNAILHWASCRAGELVGWRIMDHDTVSAMLLEAGLSAGLTMRECLATVRSGIGQGMSGQ